MKNANLALAALLLCGAVTAKESDFAEKVYVDAVKQVAEMQDNRITFEQNVIITQGTIKIHADKVVVTRSGEKGAEVMTAYGKPATFFQIMDNGKPVNAHGNSIRYELKNRLVTITGNGQLKQEDSLVTGDLIRYDIDKQKMTAESKNPTQRVRTEFLPDQVENFDKPADQKKQGK
ncbi:lipopolysaccharide transport periplasmic protein LptA [Aeromonas sobria]|uniref:Lipopolysaccharide export system protein LptA n=1 Tax=Aeromonas sobria TaxID=646 RepID=A0A1S2D0K2_AERSO|nr:MULTISPECIES: lipopolysaccharide transport periplasmic protein LptA [Aeromonas]EKP0261041.1 lipopolysaccharide transport periplasmic protein LptA [Aeromonas sobria]ELM3615413.1 lipopolysaccharide transport periplasmic protein LptA [Aeromonas sobria]MBS4688027.1 lipopolysaccharide transport periplasmic protein LptA [Aeromonas sobria]MCX7129453.1 lipopolysaccharide transport periplasmic protein LptA [Aeromonas sp.]OHY94455.1 lipopolysaccharide transport periplasmic protein LptA [Aeromonas sob